MQTNYYYYRRWKRFSSAGVTLQRNVSSLTVAFLSDVSLLDDDVQYLSCDDGSVGSVVLVSTTLRLAPR